MPDYYFGTDRLSGFDVTYWNKCWRNRVDSMRCTTAVDVEDSLGLCPEHIEELRETL